jgi:hypothetical protein
MIKKTVLLGLIFCLVFSTTVFGATSSEQNNISPLLKQPILMDQRLADYIEAIKPYYASLNAAENSNSSVAAPKAPAPPLTYLQVYAAISTLHPTYEYFSENQYTSTYNHGGGEMYIVTVELGYGFNRIARMNNGTNLGYLQSQAIVDSGNIVIGWYYWWTASAYESGQFTYQNTSTNSPWNTMSDWINIQ